MQKYLLALVLVFPVFASAHVTVMPSEVGIGERQVFNVSVPTEKDVATVGVRLIIPEGLESVRPNAKAGWDIELVKMGEGEEAMIHEIIWTGGSIPADQRDDFFFGAKVPAGEGVLVWKAYQTYADGSIVAWAISEAELLPEDTEDGSKGPYSETKIINDLQQEEIKEVVAAPMELDRDDRKEGRRGVNDCWILLSLVMSGAALSLGIYNTIPRKKIEKLDV